MDKKRTKKVMDIRHDGFHLVCVEIRGDRNPFRVYRVTNNHRRQIAKYGDFLSVIWFLLDLYRDGVDTMTLSGCIQWAKARGCI